MTEQPKHMMIILDDVEGFTVGPSMSADLVDVQNAEMTAISLREGAFKSWCADLADELNSAMSAHGWEVRLVHLDTADFLEFVARPESAEESDERSE